MGALTLVNALFLVVARIQRQPHPRRQPRIGQRPVQPFTFVQSAEQVPGHRFQAVIRQGRKGPPAELQGAVMAVGQAEAQAGELAAEKTEIERGIVRHQGALAEEAEEVRQHLPGLGLSPQHRVGDPMHPLRGPGDRPAWIDEAVELADDSLPLPGHGADLDDPVPAGRKPGRLHVQHHPAFIPSHRFLPPILLFRALPILPPSNAIASSLSA